MRVDGRPARASARLRAAQSITVEVPPPAPARAAARGHPAGGAVRGRRTCWSSTSRRAWSCTPGRGRRAGTLVNALLHHVPDLSGIGGVLRPGIVHRLDRGTSGVLVVAKDDETHRALVRQFAGRSVEKEYLALVHGVPARASGEVDAPIGRDPVHRQRMSVRAPRGRQARTSWRGRAGLRRRRAPARAHPHRPHAPDPGPPRLDRPPGGGRRDLRRHPRAVLPRRRRARGARVAGEAGAARGPARLHPPGDRRARRRSRRRCPRTCRAPSRRCAATIAP